MARLGLFSGRRVELIGGRIIEMSPQESLHATGVRLSDYALRKVFGAGFVISVQLPLSLGADSDPEPDVAVVRGSLRDFVDAHPAGAALVVEVADSSLEYDRAEKGSLYADAGIEEYWIVDLVNRRLEVRRNPRQSPDEPHGHAYATVEVLKPGERVSPLAASGRSLAVDDLLP